MLLKTNSSFEGANLRLYREKFNHSASPEAWKYKTPKEIDEIAEMALKRGKPEPTWANRPKNLLGTVSDGYYT